MHAGVTGCAGCALCSGGRKDPTFSCLSLPEALTLTDFHRKMEETHHTQLINICVHCANGQNLGSDMLVSCEALRREDLQLSDLFQWEAKSLVC